MRLQPANHPESDKEKELDGWRFELLLFQTSDCTLLHALMFQIIRKKCSIYFVFESQMNKLSRFK